MFIKGLLERFSAWPQRRPPEFRFTIDARALVSVFDRQEGRTIGTGFAFLRSDSVVTAKHVIEREGSERRQLSLQRMKGEPLPAVVAYRHPLLDLAVLKAETNICSTPLFPAHHRHVDDRGIAVVGYRPSRSQPGHQIALQVDHVPAFDVQIRSRTSGDEYVMEFTSPQSEPGGSGGPVLGPGGGVVAVVIESPLNGPRIVRATSVFPLLDLLRFPQYDGTA